MAAVQRSSTSGTATVLRPMPKRVVTIGSRHPISTPAMPRPSTQATRHVVARTPSGSLRDRPSPKSSAQHDHQRHADHRSDVRDALDRSGGKVVQRRLGSGSSAARRAITSKRRIRTLMTPTIANGIAGREEPYGFVGTSTRGRLRHTCQRRGKWDRGHQSRIAGATALATIGPRTPAAAQQRNCSTDRDQRSTRTRRDPGRAPRSRRDRPTRRSQTSSTASKGSPMPGDRHVDEGDVWVAGDDERNRARRRTQPMPKSDAQSTRCRTAAVAVLRVAS